ncbi:MAG: CBS domain-containing protein [Desulfuromonas sp.]|nr:CBS domain-containing protein [Desulfuromonas sp.]
MLTAKEIMTREVCTVHEETDLKDLAALFVEHNYKTLPVVDAAGKLVGVVSQTDLIEQDKPLHIPTVISLFDWVLYLESPKVFSDEVRKVSARKVGEICAREVITCTPDTPVEEVANLMVEHKVHLLPVLDGERLVGVVARFDLIRSLGS